jgi:hypothetical protein
MRGADEWRAGWERSGMDGRRHAAAPRGETARGATAGGPSARGGSTDPALEQGLGGARRCAGGPGPASPRPRRAGDRRVDQPDAAGRRVLQPAIRGFGHRDRLALRPEGQLFQQRLAQRGPLIRSPGGLARAERGPVPVQDGGLDLILRGGMPAQKMLVVRADLAGPVLMADGVVVGPGQWDPAEAEDRQDDPRRSRSMPLLEPPEQHRDRASGPLSSTILGPKARPEQSRGRVLTSRSRTAPTRGATPSTTPSDREARRPPGQTK